VKIYVTGIGVVSAIGLNAAENFSSLSAGRSGIRKSDLHGILLGAVQITNEELIQRLQLPPGDYSRTTLLGLMAAREAWNGNSNDDQIRTGVISATSVGGLDRMEYYYERLTRQNDTSVTEFLTHDNGQGAEAIADDLGIRGFVGTISTACSSGANAIMHGARLLEANLLDRVIVGGSDPLANYNVKGFSSLMIYDKEHCRPFDATRQGLNLGEGAAFLVLESESCREKTQNKPLCLLSGWNNSTDAHHQTASSATGKGSTLTMSKALLKAGLKPDEINYINAHGTGTENNDLSESAALKNIFGNAVPPFSSTKAFTGHTLAAAGAIEAVYCVHALCEGALLPNLNFQTPMTETGLVPEQLYRKGLAVSHVLSNSFGFGGNCTSLIFSKR
jgi:3-oxoacyl-(acyl-carrier-protein) synthase